VAWLDSLSGTVKARTLAEYRRLYETYVQAEFTTRPVGAITPADARRFRADLVKRGLARGTIKARVRRVPADARSCCASWGDRGQPATSVPRLRAGDAEPFTPHPLTSDQVAVVSEQVRSRASAYGLVVLFVAATGPTRGIGSEVPKPP
jgi:hypothetical protein